MKQDARFLQTQTRLKETLINLLKTRPLYGISVSELCREAGIGRTTFYQHYGNLSQILNELLEDILSQVRGVAEHLTDTDKSGCSWPLCEFVRRNPRFFALIRNESLTDIVLDKIVAFHMEEYIRTLRSRSEWSERQLELLFRFQISGCLSLIRKSGGMSSEEWLWARETLDQFLRQGLEIAADEDQP